MKNCWKILGIHRTNKTTEIKKAFRLLLKKYHPDIVKTPERKRKYTIKAIEIIEAYKEAIRQAQPKPISVAGNKEVIFESKERRYSWLWNIISVIAFLFFIVLISVGLHYLMNYLDSLPETHFIKIVSGILITVFVSVVIFGFCGAGVINLFIIFLIMGTFRLAERLKLEKHENKISWCLMVITNIIIFYIIVPKEIEIDKSTGNYLFFRVSQAISTLTLPLFFLLDWIKNYIKFNKIKTVITYRNYNEFLNKEI